MAAETVRDITVRIGIEQADTKIKVPGTKEAVQEVENVQDAVEMLEQKEKEAQEEAAKMAQEIQDAGLKAADSFKMMGEGAFTFARGVAFAVASNEEEMEEMIRIVAKAQSAFDLFKGSTDVIKGTIEGLRALKVATGAATAATALQAVANTAVAATATAAASAMAALQAVLGPIKLAFLAIGAAVTGIIALWHWWSGADEPVDDTAASVARLRKEVEHTSDSVEKLETVLDKVGNIASAQREVIALEEERVALNKNARDFAAEEAELRENQAAIEARIDDQRERFMGKHMHELGRAVALERAKADKLAEQRNTSEAVLKLQRDQNAVLDEGIRKAQEEIDKAKEKFLLERGILQTAKERVAAMDPAQQREFQRITEKFERLGAGGLAPEELGKLRTVAPRLVAQEEVGRLDPTLARSLEGIGRSELGRAAEEREQEEAAGKAFAEAHPQQARISRLQTLQEANAEAHQKELDILEDLIIEQAKTNNRLDGFRNQLRELEEVSSR